MSRPVTTMIVTAMTAAVMVAATSRVSTQVGGHEGHATQLDPAIEGFFKAYDAAFTAGDLQRLSTMYHPDVTVYEGGGINTGWADYRDTHLGPELKAFVDLAFAHGDLSSRALGADAAYVTANYTLTRTVQGKRVTSGGLATYVLIRDGDRWLIRHSHTSSRRVPQAGGAR